jgi:hypothetical protein
MTMSEQEKQQQQQQGQPSTQGGEQQTDKGPAADESPATATPSGEAKVKGCFDDIETGEGTGARAGEYS